MLVDNMIWFTGLPMKSSTLNERLAEYGWKPHRILPRIIFCFLTLRGRFGQDGKPCVVLWMLEALDCRVPIPTEAWKGLTRNSELLVLYVC